MKMTVDLIQFSMLTDILNNVGKFSREELEMFGTHLVKKSFKKNSILLNEGTICDKAWFIISGAVYQFKYDNIDEQVLDLHCENDWFVAHSSFISQKPSIAVIKAYSDCEVFELNISSIHQLIAQSPSFLQLGKILDISVSRLHYYDNILSPNEKYKYLLQSKPELLQKFPLGLVASYLKITRETLSRVRSTY